jgi:hypothetical protein
MLALFISSSLFAFLFSFLLYHPPAQPIVIPTLPDALSSVTTQIGLGAVISFMLERLGVFQSLSVRLKPYLVLLVCVGLPVIARLVLMFVPSETLLVLDPVWQAAAAGVIIFLGTQGMYLGQKWLQRERDRSVV